MYVVELDGDDDVFWDFKGDIRRTYLRVLTNDVIKLLQDVINLRCKHLSKDYAVKDFRSMMDTVIKEFSKPRKPQRLNLGGNYSISVSVTEPDIPQVMY